jgi:ABC-2 type transport system ATP-binding protein
MHAMEQVIETEGLTKAWGSLTAVDDINLRIPAGECYAYLGLNGAGKSTTARMLLDFIRPTRGTIRVLGGHGSDPSVRARVGYLPGDLNLPRAMTGSDAIAFFGGLEGGRRHIDPQPLIERFRLDPSRPFRELSTGNRRKVGLVLAFMTDPDLLILDEPTSGLDPLLQEDFRDLLAERKAAGATIWLTSHVMAEVERVADRVGLVREGRLARELTMAELRHQATGQIRLTFPAHVDPGQFQRVPNVTGAQGNNGEVLVSVDGPVTDVLARGAELGATGIETEKRDLDDIFLEM